MSTYRAYQVTGQRQFELVDREAVLPSAGHVRFWAHTCGVCHSDVLGVEGMRDDPSRPIVPGHEVVGVIDAVGDGVTAWQLGDRVGLGSWAVTAANASGAAAAKHQCRRSTERNWIAHERASSVQLGTTHDQTSKQS